ncbi:MAG: hypothetical protein WCY21_04270 [Candidatus Cloacimonadaceae bacterium]|jgi:hypothetical protein|nr:hypothetical protein [Candidatus Cloacimonadota bacterium]MDX9949438.1 hypothetical protein [Candidatus Syntrophosphaera sp.]NLN84763.1 hypothetical protein [Candidatus Cloacimonadota bacterium]
MKAKLGAFFHSFSGKADGMVYYYNRRLGKVIAREYVKPRANKNNQRFTEVAANLKDLNPSEGYRMDLRVYVDVYNSAVNNWEKPLLNWHNAYLKLMWAMAHALGLDLATLTRAQITEQALPCITVKDAVEAGYLPPVTSYESLVERF